MSLTAEQKAKIEEALLKIRAECANTEDCETCPLFKKRGGENQYCCFWVDKASNLDRRDIDLIIGFIDGVLSTANVRPINEKSDLPLLIAKGQGRRVPWREYIDNFGNVTLVNRETGEIKRENLNEVKNNGETNC